MQYLHIHNCRIEEPSMNPTEVLICGNKIVEIGNDLISGSTETQHLDAKGQILFPGLVNVRSHLTIPNPFDSMAQSIINTMLGMGVTATMASIKLSQIPMEYVALGRQEVPTANYSCHVLLTSLRTIDEKQMRYLSLTHGIPTAYHRMIVAGMGNKDKIRQNINTARKLGLRIILDIDSEGSTSRHLGMLDDMIEVLSEHQDNDVFFVGVHYHEELERIRSLRQYCKVRSSISFNPLHENHTHMAKFEIKDQIEILRNNDWIAAGMLDINMVKDNNLHMDGEHTLSTLTLLPIQASEAYTYAGRRNLSFIGMGTEYSRVDIGSYANLILVDPYFENTIQIHQTNGNLKSVNIRSAITTVILNGKIAKQGNETNLHEIHGEMVYRHIK